MELQSGIMKRVVKEVGTVIQSGFSNAAGLGAPEEDEPEPPPPADPKASLPWDTVPLADTTLFNHPAKYATDKETGKISWEGVVAENPGIIEKGAELLGAGMEVLSTFAKKAASGAAAHAPQQLPAAGVGQAQVVDEVPEGAQNAGPGAGSFPRV